MSLCDYCENKECTTRGCMAPVPTCCDFQNKPGRLYPWCEQSSMARLWVLRYHIGKFGQAALHELGPALEKLYQAMIPLAELLEEKGIIRRGK